VSQKSIAAGVYIIFPRFVATVLAARLFGQSFIVAVGDFWGWLAAWQTRTKFVYFSLYYSFRTLFSVIAKRRERTHISPLWLYIFIILFFPLTSFAGGSLCVRGF